MRSLGQRHYDVQLIGGIALHRGEIAEMKTGEGKTLVATLAVYLNALAGKGVHVVTVNDYLAKRDAEWMGQIYRFLGMTVGVMSVNFAMSARTSAIAGSASPAFMASSEVNWKCAIITNGAGEVPLGTPSISMTLAAFMTFIASGMWVDR